MMGSIQTPKRGDGGKKLKCSEVQVRQSLPCSPRGMRRTPSGTPVPGAPPGPAALTHFVAGALGFVVAASRLSLTGWRHPRCPGAGAARAEPQLQHVPLPRRWAGVV